MSVWQRLNAPRNKREKRVAKIARDIERERIVALLKNLIGNREAAIYVDEFIALIKGENK